jgi:hypothetical protein
VTDDVLRQLLSALAARGVSCVLDGGRVRVRPTHLLAAHEVAALRENGDSIRRLLSVGKREEEQTGTKAADAVLTAVAASAVPPSEACVDGAEVAPLDETAATPRPDRRACDREKDRERRAAAVRAAIEKTTAEMFWSLEHKPELFNKF